eukprot:TRINITY_DN130_c0_g1_i6.p1 TRINITY_DN130_c0_g1~~TRINITY_DN130_c0_g1_i6.p1  ORF type:complete len:375 (+),score=121.96 TRINITY_DN130_c0_g1_i6:87-1127(+)
MSKHKHHSKKSYSVNVRVIGARNLPAADLNGSSDPYCKLQVGYEYRWIPKMKKTKIIKKNKNPVWNESFVMDVKEPEKDKIRLIISDHDFIGSDEMLGEAQYQLSQLPAGVETNLWLPLVRRSRHQGEVNVALTPNGFGKPPPAVIHKTTVIEQHTSTPTYIVTGPPPSSFPSSGYPAPGPGGPPSGYPPSSYPSSGYPGPGGPPSGYPPSSHPSSGHPSSGYPPSSHPSSGYPAPGPGGPPSGYPPSSYPSSGYPAPGPGGPSGYPPSSHPSTGYPPSGGPSSGYPPSSHPSGSYPSPGPGGPSSGYPPSSHPSTGYPPSGGPPSSGYPPSSYPSTGYPPSAPNH